MTEPTPKEVVWTPGYLEKLGKKFLGRSEDIDAALVKLGSAILTPGRYREALSVKDQFDKRKELVAERLDELRIVFSDIGTNLIQMERKYEKTEDLNKDDILKLQELVDSVAVTFPDVDKVMPTSDGFSAETSKPTPKKPTKEES